MNQADILAEAIDEARRTIGDVLRHDHTMAGGNRKDLEALRRRLMMTMREAGYPHYGMSVAEISLHNYQEAAQ